MATFFSAPTTTSAGASAGASAGTTVSGATASGTSDRQLQTAIAEPGAWDLSAFYQGLDDPQLTDDRDLLKVRSQAFLKAFRGRVAGLAADELADAFVEMEGLSSGITALATYASLVFAANTQDPQAQTHFDRTQAAITELENKLLFFRLELQALSQKHLEALRDTPELANYRHYFDRLVQLAPHRLEESVAKVRNQDAQTGREAFIQLRSIHLGEQTYAPVTPPVGPTATSEAELSALLFHPDPATRAAAYASTRAVSREHNTLYTYILSTIAQDHAIENRLRQHPSTLAKQLLEDEVPTAVFWSVMDGVGDRPDLWQRYYRLKGKALGQPIRTCDLYAPWTTAVIAPIAYRDGVNQLLAALSQFDETYGQRAANFFSQGRVDAALRPGKRGGAFCGYSPGKPSYLFLSYTENYNSLFTLAHELGHGLHFDWLEDQQTYFNSNPPLISAEVASTFNELLLLDYLLDQAIDHDQEQALLTLQLETHLALIFRQTTVSRLELAIHDQAQQGRFQPDFVNQTWLDLYQALCGDAIEILPDHAYDWSRIGHLFFKPFYCYQYAASAIVSLACYQAYRDRGREFVPHYLKFLSLGSSVDQMVALRDELGIDLTHSATIAQGLKTIETQIDRLSASLSS